MRGSSLSATVEVCAKLIQWGEFQLKIAAQHEIVQPSRLRVCLAHRRVCLSARVKRMLLRAHCIEQAEPHAKSVCVL